LEEGGQVSSVQKGALVIYYQDSSVQKGVLVNDYQSNNYLLILSNACFLHCYIFSLFVQRQEHKNPKGIKIQKTIIDYALAASI